MDALSETACVFRAEKAFEDAERDPTSPSRPRCEPGAGGLIVISGDSDFSSRDQETPGYSARHRDTASLWRALPSPEN